jgi:hypothetical protein
MAWTGSFSERNFGDGGGMGFCVVDGSGLQPIKSFVY